MKSFWPDRNGLVSVRMSDAMSGDVKAVQPNGGDVHPIVARRPVQCFAGYFHICADVYPIVAMTIYNTIVAATTNLSTFCEANL